MPDCTFLDGNGIGNDADGRNRISYDCPAEVAATAETIGFVFNHAASPEKIDMVTYVTAHEIAHQWWAHQVVGSNQQGMTVLSETLGARESGVLRMRYGLDDGRPKTLEEIGAAFSVTRERIRQIEAKALLKLRGQQPGGRDSLEDYVDDDGDGLMGLQWKSATTKARS